ncbi:addiction module protein [Duganella sp. FT92W]|uniref:Addiction module protein n=1 Tax=Pseudoduganella rivuli TaxID=2666085 RepID=A0A7X2LVH7_9BURK|nr:addiction module protein [Pseudoduganella rivuli]MRV75466.1 addiction module protein [Pseudoduganella rivuli]
MAKQGKLLSAQLDALTAQEKIALAEELLVSACQDDPAWDDAWGREAERRLDALARGEATAKDANEVLARLSAKQPAP